MDVTEFGISFNGKVINFSISKMPNNDLMEMKIGPNKILSKLKSFGEIVKEYREEDEEKIRKIYTQIMKETASKLEKVLTELDNTLEKEIHNLENKTQKF